jgi:GH18 family chitinase
MNVSNNISKFRSSKMDFMKTVSFDGLTDVDMEKLSNDLSFTDDQRKKSV